MSDLTLADLVRVEIHTEAQGAGFLLDISTLDNDELEPVGMFFVLDVTELDNALQGRGGLAEFATDGRTWIDITCQVLELEITKPVDFGDGIYRPDVGTLSITMDLSRPGPVDLTSVRAGIKVRVLDLQTPAYGDRLATSFGSALAPWLAMFRGAVKSKSETVTDPERPVALITCVDAIDRAAQTTVRGAIDQLANERAGVMFGKLAPVLWTQPANTLELVGMRATDFEGTVAEHLDLVARSARMVWRQDHVGTPTYESYFTFYPVGGAYPTTFVLSDDHTTPGHLCYVSVDVSVDSETIINDLTFDNLGVGTSTKVGPYRDDASAATYYRRAITMPTNLVTGADFDTLAARYLTGTVNDEPRPRQVTLVPMVAGKLTEAGAQPGGTSSALIQPFDRIILTRAGVTYDTQAATVRHTITPDQWTTTLDLI